MQTVHCPHCSTRLTNDGSLSGQVVTCAACGGLFQMPAVVAVPDFEEASEPDSDDSPRRAKRPRSSRGFVLFAVIALVIMPLITMAVGISLIASGTFRGKREAPAPSQPRKKGGQ
jgi:hypothetical protein